MGDRERESERREERGKVSMRDSEREMPQGAERQGDKKTEIERVRRVLISL